MEKIDSSTLVILIEVVPQIRVVPGKSKKNLIRVVPLIRVVAPNKRIGLQCWPPD